MTENKTGRNFARNSNVDYKKIRRDVFTLVEQLTESNWILTNSLQHNEVLQKKALNTIQKMKVTINEQNEVIDLYEQEKKDWLGAKEYRDSKTEVN